MSISSNAMREQIFATPAALAAAFDQLELNARVAVATPDLFRTRRIVLCGSGDSLFAAKAAESAFWLYAGLPAEVRTPMEAGRYQSQLMPASDLENTLFVALSNSGGAARVIEAAALMRAARASVLAVTGNASGRLASSADHALLLPVPELPSAPGVGPYLFAVVGLILFAIRIGEVRMKMTMDEAQALRRQLKTLVADLAAIVAGLDGPARAAADALAGRKLMEFLGAGPSFAVADFGAAKLLEASGRHALARDLEEWTHLNYFDAVPTEIATIAVLPVSSVAQSRAVELLAYWTRLGRSVLVIGGGEASETAVRLGHRMLAVPKTAEMWSPLLTSVAVGLFAAHLAEIDGATYGRGSTGAWSDSAGGATVQQSELWSAGR